MGRYTHNAHSNVIISNMTSANTILLQNEPFELVNKLYTTAAARLYTTRPIRTELIVVISMKILMLLSDRTRRRPES